MYSAPLLSVPVSNETPFKAQIFNKENYCLIDEYFKVIEVFKVKLKFKLKCNVAVARRTEVLWKKTALASFRSSEFPPTEP